MDRNPITNAVDTIKSILDYTFKATTTVAHWYINKKISAKHTIKAGIINDYYHLNLLDSSRQFPPTRPDWQQRENYVGGTDLVQAYIQYKYRPTDAVTITAGIHGQYLTHNGSKAIEPRAALKWQPNNANTVTLGYGLHSEMQPLYQYFAHLPQYPATQMHNYDMDFTRSHHIVAGYDHRFSQTLHINTEVYYQYLFNVPVETRVGSSYSGVDQGSSFDRFFPDTLKNTGTGYNYGLEVTLEKSFGHGYFVLFSGSVYNSKAKGNDGVYRNTDFNNHYAFNILGGYEKKLGKNSTLITGAKITYAGGKLYSPYNDSASRAQGDYIIWDSARNTLKFADYFRADVKLGVRINGKKVTHEIALDLVNVTNTKNELSFEYSTDAQAKGQKPYIEQYQLGFLPLFYYRIDFGFGKRK